MQPAQIHQHPVPQLYQHLHFRPRLGHQTVSLGLRLRHQSVSLGLRARHQPVRLGLGLGHQPICLGLRARHQTINLGARVRRQPLHQRYGGVVPVGVGTLLLGTPDPQSDLEILVGLYALVTSLGVQAVALVVGVTGRLIDLSTHLAQRPLTFGSGSADQLDRLLVRRGFGPGGLVRAQAGRLGGADQIVASLSAQVLGVVGRLSPRLSRIGAGEVAQAQRLGVGQLSDATCLRLSELDDRPDAFVDVVDVDLAGGVDHVPAHRLDLPMRVRQLCRQVGAPAGCRVPFRRQRGQFRFHPGDIVVDLAFVITAQCCLEVADGLGHRREKGRGGVTHKPILPRRWAVAGTLHVSSARRRPLPTGGQSAR